MRAVFIWMLAIAILSGCGAVGGGAATLPSSPSADSGAGFDVTVTESTHSVTLRAGHVNAG